MRNGRDLFILYHKITTTGKGRFDPFVLLRCHSYLGYLTTMEFEKETSEPYFKGELIVQFKYLSFMFLVLVFVAGCEKEMVYEGIYEGLKHREEIVNPSHDPIPEERQQSYDEYKREREESLKKDNEDKL